MAYKCRDSGDRLKGPRRTHADSGIKHQGMDSADEMKRATEARLAHRRMKAEFKAAAGTMQRGVMLNNWQLKSDGLLMLVQLYGSILERMLVHGEHWEWDNDEAETIGTFVAKHVEGMKPLDASQSQKRKRNEPQPPNSPAPIVPNIMK